jgi:hypothetical protein
MNRSITIELEGVQYMVDVDMELQSSNIVYHVKTPQHFTEDLPANFDIVQHDDASVHLQDAVQARTPKGKQLVAAICEQLRTLPPQFKGGKGQEAKT